MKSGPGVGRCLSLTTHPSRHVTFIIHPGRGEVGILTLKISLQGLFLRNLCLFVFDVSHIYK